MLSALPGDREEHHYLLKQCASLCAPRSGWQFAIPPSVKCRVKLIELLLEGEEVSEFLGADKMVSSAVLHMKHL